MANTRSQVARNLETDLFFLWSGPDSIFGHFFKLADFDYLAKFSKFTANEHFVEHSERLIANEIHHPECVKIEHVIPQIDYISSQ